MGIDNVTKQGVNNINHKGGCSILNGFKNNIDSCQKFKLLPYPINNSLNKYPANIAPRDKRKSGNNITNGDSCIFSIDIFLLLYSP